MMWREARRILAALAISLRLCCSSSAVGNGVPCAHTRPFACGLIPVEEGRTCFALQRKIRWASTEMVVVTKCSS